ncbi:MAG: hypothetical protein KC455_11820 [Carnobacterium sp.]|nr:hypothetical protein [Carnobacterium sp.]
MNHIKIWRLFKKIKFYFFVKHINHKYRKEIKNRILKRKCKALNKSYAKEIKDYYNSFGIKIKPYWHHYYSEINGIFSNFYLPEDYFYSTIDLALNKREFGESLMDKNFLDRLFKNIKFPTTVVKNINGYFYNGKNELINYKTAIDLCKKHKKLIIKPSIHTGGGKKVLVFSINKDIIDYNNLTFEQLFSLYNKDFIIQEIVDQHEILKSLNITSLNTLRVMSYFSTDNIFILSSFIRIGGKRKFVDNMSSGGIACGIGLNGNLKEIGYDQNQNQVNKTHDGIEFNNITIPNYQFLMDKIKLLHIQVPYFKLISWDISIDKNSEPVLIEYNLWGQGLNPHQIINGPIFEKYLPEILKISSNFKNGA